MAGFRFDEAQNAIFSFVWGEYCDWYIEIAKTRIRQNGLSPVPVLVYALEIALRLLHPFMPFVTEEIWQTLKRTCPSGWLKSDSIMIAPYPEAENKNIDTHAERVMQTIIDIIRTIRNIRSEHNVESGQWVEAQIFAGELTGEITTYGTVIETLARSRPVTFLNERHEPQKGENVVVSVLKDAEVYIPMESMVNVMAERTRLQKEIEQNEAEMGRLETRLQDAQFTGRAPAAVVEKERNKLVTIQERLTRLKQELQRLESR
jgi:valyl-tRNA synthetase